MNDESNPEKHAKKKYATDVKDAMKAKLENSQKQFCCYLCCLLLFWFLVFFFISYSPKTTKMKVLGAKMYIHKL